jgi:uncharacterized protein (DUF1330 family)
MCSWWKTYHARFMRTITSEVIELRISFDNPIKLHTVLFYPLHPDRQWVRCWFARQDMKAYLVLDLSVNNIGGFRKYIAEIPAFIAKHSGKYIVQGVQPTTIEGDWKPERLVIIEFPAREKAEAFLGDPEIQDLFKVRHDTTTSKLVLADGCT